MDGKGTNPKDAVGSKKLPLSVIPSVALAEEAKALLDGACKYGRHNYRITGVRASVYYDAVMRHLMAWWEGENCAADSGVHHLAHARACLAILLDAEYMHKLNDDRPPKMPDQWMNEFNVETAELLDRHVRQTAPFTERDRASDFEPEAPDGPSDSIPRRY